MNKLRLNGFSSFLLGLLLSLNLISVPAQAASFKKTAKAALCMLVAMSPDSAAALTLTGGPAPAPVSYIEGEMPTVSFFNNLRLNATAGEGPLIAQLYTKGADGLQNAVIDGLEFPNCPLIKNNSIDGYYLVGNASEINALFPMLNMYIADPYEGRSFILELRVKPVQNTTVAIRNMAFLGTAVNTPPGTPFNLSFSTPFNGGKHGAQNIDGNAIKEADDIDVIYNPYDPGIRSVTLRCDGNDVIPMFDGEPCLGSCKVPFKAASAGKLGIASATGKNIYSPPKCYISFTDSDPQGINPLSSPWYPLAINPFDKPLTPSEKVRAYTVNFFIGSTAGLSFCFGVLKGINAYYSDKRHKIDPIAAKVVKELNLNIVRFPEKTQKSGELKEVGPEPTCPWKCCGRAQSGAEFREFIANILDKVAKLGIHTMDSELLALAIAKSIRDSEGIYFVNQKCYRSNTFKYSAVTPAKISTIAESVAQQLRESQPFLGEVEDSKSAPEHSTVELVELGESELEGSSNKQ